MVDLNRLKELMAENGWKAPYVCAKLGKNRGLISDWGRGKNLPTDSEIQILADLFNVSVDYITGKSDTRKALSPEEESALDEGIQRLIKITKDFTPKEFEMLIQHADLLEAARRKEANH